MYKISNYGGFTQVLSVKNQINFITAIAITPGIPPKPLTRRLTMFTGREKPVISEVKCTAKSAPTPVTALKIKDLIK